MPDPIRDYYPLIAKAVAALTENTEGARRSVYERTRNALRDQLSTHRRSQRASELRNVEIAIRVVEMERNERMRVGGFWENLFGSKKTTTSKVVKTFRKAVANGDIEAAKALLEAWPNLVVISYENGQFALHEAVQHDRHELIELLLALGADPNCRTFDGDTPLHYAAYRGDASAANLLLANGAEMNAKNNEDSAPMYLAESFGFKDCVKLLDERGASPIGYFESLGYPAGTKAVRCLNCGSVYALGVDAISMSSEELNAMIPILIGNLQPMLMIGRTTSRGHRKEDEQTILHFGPNGWVCAECKADNKWYMMTTEYCRFVPRKRHG